MDTSTVETLARCPVMALVLLAAGCGPPGQEPPGGQGRARALEFPPDCVPDGWRLFGFEIEQSGARVEDVHGLPPGWLVQIGPETGDAQVVSAHCLRGVSALQDASMLPRFVIREETAPGRGGGPEVCCRLVLTQDFESFDTLGCDMRLDHPGAGR